ncbi:hypothetical protein AWJ20_2803 [Sugiyamaella lignohabitans]|uniref:Rad60/SUMO-like domain-containing protein n=1 Tax=Sugiyamaella lignohabitans TaxID=796027 RepID=A0A167FDZ0_9ASCO|nr:uncharacterized protein AWJ20_2803 [Sugiyamaella lignohabitans]ANB15179.1 hypothetical protein AWJ20_2803 [Sugiyamaella lignohabitans]
MTTPTNGTESPESAEERAAPVTTQPTTDPGPEKPKLSKWKQRRKLRPAAKKTPSVTESDSGFFSMAHRFSIDDDDDEPDDKKTAVEESEIKPEATASMNKKVDKSLISKSIGSVESELSKLAGQSDISAQPTMLSDSRSILVNGNKTAREPGFEPQSMVSFDTKPISKSRPATRAATTQAKKAADTVIILDDSDNTSSDIEIVEDSTPPDVSGAKRSVVDPTDDPFNTIQQLKLRALKRKKVENVFEVSVNISSDMPELGNCRSTVMTMKSNEPFGVLKILYTKHCVENRLNYFEPKAIELLIETAVLVWNDTVLNEDVVTPSSLGITNANSVMSINIMSRFDYDNKQKSSVERLLSEENYTLQAILASTSTQTDTRELQKPDNLGPAYFRVRLKDKDNAQFEVRVNSETKISKLVDFYLRNKNLPQNTKIRLDFDEEPLDLDGVVGDTELEEDYTIHVYIL